MSYKTELMEAILKSPQAQRISQMISPVYGAAYTFLWLIQAVGMALDDAQRWAAKVATEITPATATWSIEFWESEYGIIPEPSWTFEQRRQNVMLLMHYVLPMPPERLADIATNSAAVPVDIIERTAKNKFDVVLRSNTDAIEVVKAEVNKYKPAHLIYDIYIAKQINPDEYKVYVGAAASVKRHYRVEVI